MYADEGISGTSTKKRTGFNRMIKDALDGKINLILAKSLSRFCRNTVDSLTNIRKLKAAGVECYFEKESIWTMDSKGELLIIILSSLAQEESRSISENVKWGKRKSFADGKVCVPFTHLLGYERGADGNLAINDEEAEIVRLIYKLFMSGLSYQAIANELTKRRIRTPGGKDNWCPTTVKSILTSEKMKGDALLQKTYIEDFLTKKQVKNRGQIPQYYVTGNHEAIISPETFDLVQTEICNTADLETERDRLAREMQMVSEMAKNAIRKNATIAQDQNEYQKRYDELVKQYEDTKSAYEKTVAQIENLTVRNNLLNSFSKELRKQENILKEFDEGLWGSLVDFMTVHSKEDIEVTFKDGTTIRIE